MSEDLASLLQSARELIRTDQRLGATWLTLPGSPLPQADDQVSPDLPCQSALEALPEMTAQRKAEALEALASQEVAACRACGLAGGRTKVVFGEGDPDARLVFIGEGPGQEEDLSGRPFVGRAGELLTRMIAAMGLTRQQVYIANMVKCRPPGNRTPAPQEVQACWSYLVRQLEIIRPRVIVTLGNPSTQGLLRTPVGITRLRGQWHKLPAISAALEGIDVMPTFHPAYVLRNNSVDCRSKVWSDLQQVMARLGLPMPKRRWAPEGG